MMWIKTCALLSAMANTKSLHLTRFWPAFAMWASKPALPQ